MKTLRNRLISFIESELPNISTNPHLTFYEALSRIRYAAMDGTPAAIEALQRIDRGVEAGNLEAQFLKAISLRSMRKRARQIIPLAEHGYMEAQFELGYMYLTETGVHKSKRRALYWWKQAAEQGHPEAQYELGTRLFNTFNPSKQKEGIEWWTKAAMQGNREASGDLGHVYFCGEGVKRDTAESYIWYSLPDAKLPHAEHSCAGDVAKSLSPERLQAAQAELRRRHSKIVQAMEPRENGLIA